ncbi:acyl carrier protein [Streptomyces cylindrosporus]|uniref:Acyl carrier protein n=1 Tax=Streptomyces cylindrosporus TaxID=2927583 RepID=A0ABS9YCV0_9ACTN|nr:acyl carrier protein [Streptomyces cylindrosporus]MCI3275045.1 acyl carrier protein [Streptomyces cylindrosporus]
MSEHMPELTIDRLARVMRECAGEDEAAAFDGDIAHVPLAELGYDSLAVMETAVRLQNEYGVHLTDDEIFGVESLAELLALARRQIPAAS